MQDEQRRLLHDGFIMGLQLAKHLDSSLDKIERANKISELLSQVANGYITLLDGTADAFTNFPVPPGLMLVDPKAVEERLNAAKEQYRLEIGAVTAKHKQYAGELLKDLS